MGKHLQSHSACFLSLHDSILCVFFVFFFCKFIAKLSKRSIFNAFQDKSDTWGHFSLLKDSFSSFFLAPKRRFLSWCLLNCSQGVASATDRSLLSNAHPMGSIVEKVIMYEKKEICSSHLHHKLESDSQKAKFCGCIASADLLAPNFSSRTLRYERQHYS